MPDKMKDSGELSHKKTGTGADNTEKVCVVKPVFTRCLVVANNLAKLRVASTDAYCYGLRGGNSKFCNVLAETKLVETG